MTASEAIEKINEVLDSEYHYDETLGYQLTSDDFEWLEKAKQALEKQIPKKLDGKDEDDLVCGCHRCYEVNALWKMNGDRNGYCGNCGQALDWSDTE